MKTIFKHIVGLPACLTISSGVAEHAFGQLEKAIVSDHKRGQNLKDLPISMSVLTSENGSIIQEFRPEQAGQAIDWTAGVFYTDFEELVCDAISPYITFDPAFRLICHWTSTVRNGVEE